MEIAVLGLIHLIIHDVYCLWQNLSARDRTAAFAKAFLRDRRLVLIVELGRILYKGKQHSWGSAGLGYLACELMYQSLNR